MHQPSWFRKTLQVRQLDGDLTNSFTYSQPLNSIDLTDRTSLSGSDVFESINKSDRLGNGSSDLANSHSIGQLNNASDVLNDLEQSSVKDLYDKSISIPLPSSCYSKSRHCKIVTLLFVFKYCFNYSRLNETVIIDKTVFRMYEMYKERK